MTAIRGNLQRILTELEASLRLSTKVRVAPDDLGDIPAAARASLDRSLQRLQRPRRRPDPASQSSAAGARRGNLRRRRGRCPRNRRGRGRVHLYHHALDGERPAPSFVPLPKLERGRVDPPPILYQVYASFRAAPASSMNSLGVRSPSAECGRSSLYSLLQASIRSRASAIDRNQLAFSSSCLSRAFLRRAALALALEAVQHLDHPEGGDTHSRHDRQRLAGVAVNDGEHASACREERVRDEVHRPDLVRGAAAGRASR